MDWFTDSKLNKIGDRANPDPRFVRALESKLKKEMGHPAWWIRWSRLGAMATSVVFVFSGAMGAYAYNSPNVLPDHPLYGLRQALERAELQLATSPEKKTQVQAKHLERRIEELEQLLLKQQGKDPEKFKEISDRLQEKLEEAGKASAEHKSESPPNDARESHIDKLREIQKNARTDAEREALENVLNQEQLRLEEKIDRVEKKRDPAESTQHKPEKSDR
jgi:hypothetical protein